MGRPYSGQYSEYLPLIHNLFGEGISKRQIARRLYDAGARTYYANLPGRTKEAELGCLQSSVRSILDPRRRAPSIKITVTLEELKSLMQNGCWLHYSESLQEKLQKATRTLEGTK